MKLDALLPYNNQVIRTCTLKELGYSTSNINKLVEDNYLEKTRRGYYKVNIKSDADIDLMKYYLLNNMYEDFINYFNSIELKDYQVYYHMFMYNIIRDNYAEAYKSLVKCCELNNTYENRLNLYAYILLLGELMSLSENKLSKLKKLIMKDQANSIESFLECLIKKDYDGACRNLRVSKSKKSLSKLEIQVFRELSLRAQEVYNKKSSPVMTDFKHYIKTFNEFILNDDYNGAYYYFNKAYKLKEEYSISDSNLDIVSRLFGCYNFIVDNQDITLDTYRTNFKYNETDEKNFYKSIYKNDYLNSLKFIDSMLEKETNNIVYLVYKKLLERIYNFLNIRYIIKNRSPLQTEISLNELVRRKKYSEALDYTLNSEMNNHDKNMVTCLLESIVELENSGE